MPKYKKYPCSDYYRKSNTLHNAEPYSYCSQNYEPYSANQYSAFPGGLEDRIIMRDYGPEPFVLDIDKATKQNTAFRTVLWTGNHLQLTLMSIRAGEDIGLEMHPNLDQFIRVEEGRGLVMMGSNRNYLDYQRTVSDGFAFIIPAGTWHNLINTGNTPIKLYSIYAPPQHPFGTVHVTKADAMAASEKH